MPLNLKASSNASTSEPPPKICTAIFVIDLLPCVLWFGLLILMFIAFVWNIFSGSFRGVLESIAGMLAAASIGVVGPVTNFLLLTKKPLGLSLGWAYAAATLVSVVLECFFCPPGTRIALIVTSVIFRLLWLGVYLAALVLYAKWHERQAASSAAAE